MRANIRTCVEEYRANPWPAGGGLYRGDGTPGDNQPPPAPDRATLPPLEATLDTQDLLLHRIGEQSGRPPPRARLRDGDTIATEDRSGVVTFGDGSRVEVEPHATLTLGDIRGKSLVHLRGRVFMDIKSRNWTIRVPGAKGAAMVAVRGTQFTLDVDEDGDLRVEVTEGTVEVISGGVTRAVSAGSSVITTPGEIPASPLALPSTVSESAGTIGFMSLLILAAAMFAVNRLTVGVLRRRRRRAGS